jgi:hypothetical protein
MTNLMLPALESWLAPVLPLLAQTGTTKTLIGWVIVLLCIGLGLLVVCRPSARADKKRG